jgi:hypothetical protein
MFTDVINDIVNMDMVVLYKYRTIVVILTGIAHESHILFFFNLSLKQCSEIFLLKSFFQKADLDCDTVHWHCIRCDIL